MGFTRHEPREGTVGVVFSPVITTTLISFMYRSDLLVTNFRDNWLQVAMSKVNKYIWTVDHKDRPPNFSNFSTLCFAEKILIKHISETSKQNQTIWGRSLTRIDTSWIRSDVDPPFLPISSTPTSSLSATSFSRTATWRRAMKSAGRKQNVETSTRKWRPVIRKNMCCRLKPDSCANCAWKYKFLRH